MIDFMLDDAGLKKGTNPIAVEMEDADMFAIGTILDSPQKSGNGNHIVGI